MKSWKPSRIIFFLKECIIQISNLKFVSCIKTSHTTLVIIQLRSIGAHDKRKL